MTTTSQFCGKCGQIRVNGSDGFCRLCGARFDDLQPTQSREAVALRQPDVQRAARDTVRIVALVLLVIGASLAVVGAILPWQNAPLGVSRAGAEGDGILTLAAGVVVAISALVLFLLPNRLLWTLSLVLVSAGLNAFVVCVVVYDGQQITNHSGTLIRVGSGVYVTGSAGVVGFVGSLLLLVFTDWGKNRRSASSLSGPAMSATRIFPRISLSKRSAVALGVFGVFGLSLFAVGYGVVSNRRNSTNVSSSGANYSPASATQSARAALYQTAISEPGCVRLCVNHTPVP